ncbi:extensin family protein [Rhizobium sp. SAFR-030]|uniref:extensin-like domain-containing protein n=1 Tax=Rhizobium sp. SAFR-030 TaxID=3387277 RepID=UPI003F7FB80C
MAYAFTSRRALAFLMISTMLVGCSADGLVPPGSIDSGTRVSSIQTRRPVAVSPVDQGYGAAGRAPVQAGQSLEPLDAGPSQMQPMPPAQAATGRLPMIDSDEAMAPPPRVMGAPPASLGTLTYDSNGVNMDAEMGLNAATPPAGAPVIGLAQEQDADIAEGDTSQPVVDGIGTDNPVPVGRRASAQRMSAPMVEPASEPFAGASSDAEGEDLVVVPPKRSGQAARNDIDSMPPRQSAPRQGQPRQPAPRWGDASPVTPPSRAPQEVAMLMPNNPTAPQMSVRPDQPMPASELACRRELKRMGVEFVDKPRISDGGSCGIDYPVSLSGLSGSIDVKPAVVLNCQTTLAFAKWVKNELAPSARLRYLTGIGTIQPMGGYSCRRMNNSRQRYNPMSEHARGNAIDIGKFVLKNGHAIDVRKKGFFSFREGGLLKAVRSDSCKYFNTVLGPGSNKEHWNHFHFDLRSRASGNRYCS